MCCIQKSYYFCMVEIAIVLVSRYSQFSHSFGFGFTLLSESNLLNLFTKKICSYSSINSFRPLGYVVSSVGGDKSIVIHFEQATFVMFVMFLVSIVFKVNSGVKKKKKKTQHDTFTQIPGQTLTTIIFHLCLVIFMSCKVNSCS